MTPLRCANAPLTATSFVRLARRSLSTSRAQSAAPLEFLLPATGRTAGRHPRLPASTSSSSPAPRLFGSPIHIPRRTFTASASRHATVCVHNPQKDEDGNLMMLEITPRAATRLSEIMTKDANPNLALRIQVESGGCHGFQYLMSLTTIPAQEAQESSELNEGDSIFQFAPDDAASAPSIPVAPRIILDEPSLDLLKGSKVDFTMELIGSQFTITDNPAATSSCGCGTSFDIKM